MVISWSMSTSDSHAVVLLPCLFSHSDLLKASSKTVWSLKSTAFDDNSSIWIVFEVVFQQEVLMSLAYLWLVSRKVETQIISVNYSMWKKKDNYCLLTQICTMNDIQRRFLIIYSQTTSDFTGMRKATRAVPDIPAQYFSLFEWMPWLF